MEIKKLIKDKKGLGIRDIYPIVLTITIIAILLGIMFMILTEWKGVTNTNDGLVVNETLTTVTYAGEVVSNATKCGFAEFAVSTAINSTDGIVINSGNYTTNAGTGRVSVTTAGGDSSFNNTDWNVTYTFKYGGEDCEAVEDIVESYTDFVPWIGIILLVIAAAIVLGIVIDSFAKKSRV